MSHHVASSLSPAPILDAFESFRGTFADLDRGQIIDAASLSRGRDAVSRALCDHGLSAGDRVVVAVGNGPLFPATLCGLLAADASPLLVHADSPPAELFRTAANFGARFIFCDREDDVELHEGATASKSLAVGDWARATIAEVDSNDPAFQDSYPSLPGVPLHPTSGTTGRPKVAARPGPCAVAEPEHYIETIGIDHRDRLLCVVPMSHAYGYGTCCMAPLLCGASVVTTRRFNPKLVARALRSEEITIFPAVPAMLDILLLRAGKHLSEGPSTVLSAGAPLPERTAERFHEATGVRVRPLYGTTETGGIAVSPPDEHAAVGGCVGPAMNGVSVEVRPVEEDSDLGEGVGRLFVRSTSMMTGYLSHDGIDESRLAEGWFETGDLAVLDDAGRIHLKGREKEVINVFGMKVIPGEVEDVLALLPDVVEAKVYPGLHRTGSQIVKAAVAGTEIDESMIRTHCEKHLAPFKRPEIIHLVDALPRTAMGKIIRDELP